MKKYNAIFELTRARLLNTYFREPESIFWVFCFPLIVTLVLGFAFKNRGAL